MQEKYRGKVQCIHIDPPYNTNTSGFLYKNNFLHSSWLAMMENRITAALPMLSDRGIFQCHIDENEYERLHSLCENIFPHNAGTVIWDKRNPVSGGSDIASKHEYVICFAHQTLRLRQEKANGEAMLKKAAAIIKACKGVNEESRRLFKEWVSDQKFSESESMYCLIDNDGRVFRPVHMGAPNYRQDPKFHEPLLHEKNRKPCPVPSNGFSSTPEFIAGLLKEKKILFGKDEKTQPQQKYFLDENLFGQMSSIIPFGKKER